MMICGITASNVFCRQYFTIACSWVIQRRRRASASAAAVAAFIAARVVESSVPNCDTENEGPAQENRKMV